MAKKKAKKTCADCIHEWACQAWMLGTNHNTDAQGCAMHETVRESAAYFIGFMDGQLSMEKGRKEGADNV